MKFLKSIAELFLNYKFKNDMKCKTVKNIFLIILLFVGTASAAFSDNNEIAQTQKKITGRVIDEQGELLLE